MNTAEKQKGMTAIGWMLTIAVISFFSIMLVKLFPVYIDRFNVSSVMSTLENDPAVSTMGSEEISQKILNGLKINMVSDITKDNIYISESNGVRIIELDYQVRRNLLGNHDMLISYVSRIEVPAQ